MTLARIRRLPLTLALLLLGVLIGLFFVSQWQANVRPERVSPALPPLALDQAVTLLDEQVASQRERIEALETDLRQQQTLARESPADRALANRLDDLSDAVGLTANAGDGVIITLADSPRAVGSFGVVSAADLRDLVNALWRHGASAIAINNERIVATTSIDAVVNTVLINSTKTTQPFTIQVTGNARSIDQALSAPGVLAALHERVKLEGVQFGTRRDRVELPAFRGSFLIEHATVESE